MKKIILGGILFSVLFPLMTFAYFDSSLKYGSKGDAVIELQDFLVDQGFLIGKVDGRFGLITRKAVIAFQVANDLKGDGYFGILSRGKANNILATELEPSIQAENEEIVSTPPPTPVVIDVCKNIEGLQSAVPNSMYANLNGECFPLLPASSIGSTPAPTQVIVVEPTLPQTFNLSGEADSNFSYPVYAGKKLATTIGSFNLKNNSASNIRVNKLIVKLFDKEGNKLSYSTSPLISDVSSIATTESSGAGMNPIFPMAVNNFDVDFILYPNQIKTINIKADITSGELIKIELLATGKTN
jgi:peptidoglycan hydrolase-like protein with peptidoglycan-binding domain